MPATHNIGFVSLGCPKALVDSERILTQLLPPGGLKLTPRHYAYLKISEGCNHRCSFCIIPGLRGDLVSRPAGEFLDVRITDAGEHDQWAEPVG